MQRLGITESGSQLSAKRPSPNFEQPGLETQLTSRTWKAPTVVNQLDLVLVGDTAFGANYQERAADRGRKNILSEYGYDHGFEYVDHILQSADLAIANLETPLTHRRDSLFKDIRPYIHYDDPEQSLRHLLSHNIGAVTLANNHTHDMGEPGLTDTLQALESRGVLAIGAGRTLTEANLPLRVLAEIEGGSAFRGSFLSRFWGGQLFREEIKAHATQDTPGSAPLDTPDTARVVSDLRAISPQEFIVVMPHWRRDYKWASRRQRETAQALVKANVDLIVGHGSHMAQEIDFLDGRLVLNGIGNFIFNSAGRYKKMGVPPYSAMVRLSVTPDEIVVHIYPIHTDNRLNGYQPRPVGHEEFSDFYSTALQRTNDAPAFRAHVRSGEDEYGSHLAVGLRRDGRLQGYSKAGAIARRLRSKLLRRGR